MDLVHSENANKVMHRYLTLHAAGSRAHLSSISCIMWFATLLLETLYVVRFRALGMEFEGGHREGGWEPTESFSTGFLG